MLKIGLTGGIGSGKSTVAKYFSQLGVAVLDADEIVHRLLNTSPIVKKISRHFGSEITKKVKLDRKKMRQLIFANPQKRRWLEKLLHPLVYKALQIPPKTQTPYLILVIPLLIETSRTKDVDRILVVDSTQKNRLQRLLQRDNSNS